MGIIADIVGRRLAVTTKNVIAFFVDRSNRCERSNISAVKRQFSLIRMMILWYWKDFFIWLLLLPLFVSEISADQRGIPIKLTTTQVCERIAKTSMGCDFITDKKYRRGGFKSSKRVLWMTWDSLYIVTERGSQNKKKTNKWITTKKILKK